MFIYVCSTVGTIATSTAATLCAALKYSNTAAVLAGCATLLMSVEKSLLFREKWKLHLTTKTALEAVDLDLSTGKITDEQAADELKRIKLEYSHDLPVTPRT
jgi:hypothetical protein